MKHSCSGDTFRLNITKFSYNLPENQEKNEKGSCVENDGFFNNPDVVSNFFLHWLLRLVHFLNIRRAGGQCQSLFRNHHLGNKIDFLLFIFIGGMRFYLYFLTICEDKVYLVHTS